MTRHRPRPLSKIVIDTDVNHDTDVTYFFADSPEEPRSISEFVKLSPTRISLERLARSLISALASYTSPTDLCACGHDLTYRDQFYRNMHKADCPALCRFDVALGIPARSALCGKPTIATCIVRDEPTKRKRVCADHLQAYARGYITWYELDVIPVVYDQDRGDEHIDQ